MRRSILNISVTDQMASITMHFHSVQTRVATDKNGEPLDPKIVAAREFNNIWTFERDFELV